MHGTVPCPGCGPMLKYQYCPRLAASDNCGEYIRPLTYSMSLAFSASLIALWRSMGAHCRKLESTPYSRRKPENTALYQIIQNNLQSFIEARNLEGRPLPAYVISEFEAFLKCGILSYGFIRLKCQECRTIAISGSWPSHGQNRKVIGQSCHGSRHLTKISSDKKPKIESGRVKQAIMARSGCFASNSILFMILR